MVPVELFIEELIFYELKDDVWANFCESEGCRIRTAEKKPENAFQRRVWELVGIGIFIRAQGEWLFIYAPTKSFLSSDWLSKNSLGFF